MKLIFGRDAVVAAWVAPRIPEIGHLGGFGICAAIGIAAESGQLLAGVVYHAWNPRQGNIELSIAARHPAWLTRGVIGGLLSFPYRQLDCQRTTVIVAGRNTRSRRLAEGLGWRVEGVIRRGFRDDDAIILGLLREDATPWIGEHPWAAAPRAEKPGAEKPPFPSPTSTR